MNFILSWKYSRFYFSTFLVLSLGFFSLISCSNTSALRHDIQSLPLASESSTPMPSQPAGSTSHGNPYFQIQWKSEYSPSSSSFHIDYPVYFFSSRVSNNKCTFVGGRDTYSHTPYFNSDTHTFSFGFSSYRTRNSSYYDQDSGSICKQTLPFGDTYSGTYAYSSHPVFDNTSLNNIPPLDRVHYNVLPYYFSYNGVYRYDSTDYEGTDFSHALHFSELTGFNISKPHTIVIPLGQSQSDITGQITEGRNLTYTGQLSFDGSFAWRSDIGNNLQFKLNWMGKNSSDIANSSNHTGSESCNVTTVSLPAVNQTTVKFSCSLDSPIDVLDDMFYAWLYIHDSDYEYLFDTTGDMVFSVAYLTTDFNDSPGAPIGPEIVGNDAVHAPGSASNALPDSYQDFNLANLFNFGFFNPFQPLFNLFASDTSCASIPTISSWLHTEDTQVCHFFPVTVRNVLTPVFGLASTMLIFGFAVRWLGSSSGNFFEDTAQETIGYDGHHFRPRLSYRAGIRRINK